MIYTFTKQEVKENPIEACNKAAALVMKYVLGRRAKDEIIISYGFILSQFMNAQNIGYKFLAHKVMNDDGTLNVEDSKTILEVAADFAFAGINVHETYGREIFDFVKVIASINAAAYIASKNDDDVLPEEEFSKIEIDIEMGQSPIVRMVL